MRYTRGVEGAREISCRQHHFGNDRDYKDILRFHLGAWVAQGIIFIACVLLFRRGIVGIFDDILRYQRGLAPPAGQWRSLLKLVWRD